MSVDIVVSEPLGPAVIASCPSDIGHAPAKITSDKQKPAATVAMMRAKSFPFASTGLASRAHDLPLLAK